MQKYKYFRKKLLSLHANLMKFMKRIILSLLIIFTSLSDVFAVLKEKNLDNTLNILRTELTTTHRELASQSQSEQKRAKEVFTQLINIMNRSNQNSLMLYSQKEDYVFNLTYACHEATEQYKTFQREQLPFKNFIEQTQYEITRYDSLISSLKKMPAAMLSSNAQTDRSVCLALAVAIRDRLEATTESNEEYMAIYKQTEQRLSNINAYANKRYNDIQTSIFKNGGESYVTMLSKLSSTLSAANRSITDKYRTNPRQDSQWDSRIILSLFVIIFFYAVISSALNVILIKYLAPRRFMPEFFRTDDFIGKRPYIITATTTVTFALIVGLIKINSQQNFISMAADLLVEFAWLLGVILFSLLLRLKPEQIRSSFRIYSPLLFIGFMVIAFRIVLIPNELVNLIFPPMLLACMLWQWKVIKSHRRNIPRLDMFYTYTSLVVFVVSVFLSWKGYTLASVQLIIWWIMQLTCVLSITCVSDWIKIYGVNRGFLDEAGKDTNVHAITKTWLYSLVEDVLLPACAVSSVMISIYWAADVFNLSDLCWNAFNTCFIDVPNLKLSIMRICVVVVLWFVFSYISRTVLALVRMHFYHKDPTSVESHFMMAKNVIQVFVWGAWFLFSLNTLGVSFTWLVVISGGLSTGIGFASKDILENIYYGISLMTGRIKVGDLIECDGIRGKVSNINYTSTMIESVDGSVIAFQNSQLFTKNYKNLTRNHGYVLSTVIFGVGYGSNIKEVIAMIEKSVTALHHPSIDSQRPIKVIFIDFADSSINLKLLCWVDVLKQSAVESDVKNCIYETLNENGVEIPFPQQDVYIKNFGEVKKTEQNR